MRTEVQPLPPGQKTWCSDPFTVLCLVAQSCLTLWSHGLQPFRLLYPWDSPGKNTGVGCQALLQEIFPTQGSNPGLLHFRQILYDLSHKGSPRILEWVAYPFSSGPSRSSSWIRISCIASGFFTSWATREDPQTCVSYFKIQYSFYYAMLKYLTPNVIKKSNLEKVNRIKVVLVTHSWHSI